MITPLSFGGKKVIVTGAGRGLGKLLVKSIVENDGTVFALSKTKEKLEELKEECPQVSTIQVDLSNYDETRRLLLSLEPVHMLVNNAAINIPGEMMKVSKDDFDRTFNSNVLSSLNVTQIIAEKMISNRMAGSIVNISSIAERMVVDRQGLYGISKSALGAMSRNLAHELGPHNIRVNCVCPGLFPSDMSKKALDNPKSRMVNSIVTTSSLRRIGTASEIANVVLFLLHEGSSYINGESIFVCG
ncbi:carbonyl reductase [NADPH] 2-like [Folsomia candida]|uniref:carbonyl reductase [NADPH] 2-like n=1 Tax=Folsomia candida TaxID=158441 RepID=UPI001604F58B|nr:carbonyl reductase [NADPH] 2-like [Folsomia candida]